MLIPSDVRDWETLLATFRWDIPERLNLAEYLCTRHARQAPESTAVVVDYEDDRQETVSYGELEERSARLAGAFAACGLVRGDRVAVTLEQGWEALVSYLAVFRLGLVAVPLSGMYGGDALAERIDDAGVRIWVTDRSSADKLSGSTPSCVDLVVIAGGGASGNELEFETLLELATPHWALVDTAADEPAVIFYTSGSTGSPKGAVHAHRIAHAHTPSFQLGFELGPRSGDVYWTPTDWAWLGSLGDVVLTTLFFGYPLIASPGRFRPARAYDLIVTHRITCPYLATSVLRRMWKEPPPPATELQVVRAIMTGGEAMPAEVLDWSWRTFQAPVNDEFGLTESNQTATGCSSLYRTPAGSVGRVNPGRFIAILDRQGFEVATGDRGEIAVWADDPITMLGYWNQPQRTAAVIREGWFLTGDTGSLDAEGFLYYHGRFDHLILVNGLRVGPDEIEDQIRSHSQVVEVGVIGVPDPASGQAVIAFVQLLPNVAPSPVLADELRALVRRRLGPHYRPREFVFTETIPVTSTGKTHRSALLQNHLLVSEPRVEDLDCSWVHVRRAGGVLEIVLDRPPANAIDVETSDRLAAVFRAFDRDEALRVAILSGAGERFFCVGADLKEAAAGGGFHQYSPGGFGGLLENDELEKPVIAAINGLCVGGGFELALACDLVVAAAHVEFFLPEVGIGNLPDAATLCRLLTRLPRNVAMEMLYLGARIDAPRAQALGLANRVVPGDQVMDTARSLAAEVLKSAPLPVRALKPLAAAVEALTPAQATRAQHAGELGWYLRVGASQDALEGPAAFAEKRAPVWTGC